jgi:2,4-dienoyl-CoA reductase-like NADH-dependent reductase (Old Yellow Enzyme family)
VPNLFDPYALKDVTLRNRIAVSPMCQYMAEDGVPGDWHSVHYPGMARGGAGLVVVEATAVSPEGRISPGDTGIWNDAQRDAFAPIVRQISAAGAVPGIQIAHAGRKASANRPWEGDDHIPDDAPGGWPIIAASAIPFGANLPKVPRAMTEADIARVQQDFVAAAIRARDAGFRWLMLHFAHGYLAQSFFSPHGNQRTDGYGGDAERRGRFLIETLRAVRAVWPENLPLSARFSVIEFDGRDEEMVAEAIDLARHFKDEGLDFLDVSVGFNTPTAKVPWGTGLLIDTADRVLRESGLPGSTSWLIDTPALADDCIRSGKLDLVMLGRVMLENPHWPYQAARELGLAQPAGLLPISYSHWLSRYRRN